MIYVYALAAGIGEVADLTGVAGEALVLVPLENAVAVCGEMPTLPAVDAPTLKLQDALVRALHERSGALLPMRFGTSAADTAAVSDKIRAVEGLVARLARVRDCEQMTVRVIGPSHARDESSPPPQTGTEYLLARAKRQQAGPELKAIADAPGHLSREVLVDIGTQPGVIGSVYHLIERGRADEYRAAVDRAAHTLAGVRVVVTGPAPAYAFA